MLRTVSVSCGLENPLKLSVLIQVIYVLCKRCVCVCVTKQTVCGFVWKRLSAETDSSV